MQAKEHQSHVLGLDFHVAAAVEHAHHRGGVAEQPLQVVELVAVVEHDPAAEIQAGEVDAGIVGTPCREVDGALETRAEHPAEAPLLEHGLRPLELRQVAQVVGDADRHSGCGGPGAQLLDAGQRLRERLLDQDRHPVLERLQRLRDVELRGRADEHAVDGPRRHVVEVPVEGAEAVLRAHLVALGLDRVDGRELRAAQLPKHPDVALADRPASDDEDPSHAPASRSGA